MTVYFFGSEQQKVYKGEKPGSYERRKRKDKINTKTKHDISSGLVYNFSFTCLRVLRNM